MAVALLRVLLLPPILLLVSPSPSHPIISSGTLAWAVLLVALLGFSSGYFGSLPMIIFSQKVQDPRHLELAGKPLDSPAPPYILYSCRNNHDAGITDWADGWLHSSIWSYSTHLHCLILSMLY